MNGFSFLLRISALCMGAIIFLTFLQVVLRYAFHQPLSWIEEASRYLFVWIVMLGSAIAFRTGQHIRIDFTSQYIGHGANTKLELIRLLLSTIAAAMLLYSSSLVAWRNRYSTFYTIPELPLLLLYLAIPLCSILMLSFLLERIKKMLWT